MSWLEREAVRCPFVEMTKGHLFFLGILPGGVKPA